jgi:thermostable 8-oxoguanine DNA glycosylase
MAKTVKPSVKDRWNPAKVTVEDNSGEIITKPNQSQSIREILFRNTQGMSYDNYKTPYYEEQASFSSQSLNKIQDMEPTEKLQYLKELNTQVKDLESKIKADEKAKAEAIAQAQAQAEAQAQQNNKETTTESE